MAFYRILKIDNKSYHYHIGKKYVKIKEVGDILKQNIFNNIHGICTPLMIKNYILGIPNKAEQHFFTCKCKNVEKNLRIIPFDLEIYEKKFFAYICQDCYDNNAENI